MSRARISVWVLIGGAVLVGLPAASAELPPAPDEAVIAAWEKAGAVSGWMSVSELGTVTFRQPGNDEVVPGSFPNPKVPQANELPAFRCGFALLPGISRLPSPRVPFGLVLQAGPKDMDLTELGGLKQLRVLSLVAQPWQTVSLKGLAAPGQLQALHCDLPLKGEDLKGLSNLTQLNSLCISLVDTTGLQEFGRLKELHTLSLTLNSPYKRIDSDAALALLVPFWRGQRLHNLTLSLYDTHVTEAGLKELAGLPELRLTLGLSQNRLERAGYRALARVEQVRSLDLNFTDVTDVDLKELAGLSQLEELTLLKTQVSDAGMPELARFKRLRHLNLAATNVTDAGVAALADHRALQGLVLAGTKTTGACLRHVVTLKQLQWLSLSDSVTDADLKQLAGMSLADLLISSAAQTDLGLAHYLAATRPREVLRLAFWKVSDASMKDLGRQKQLRVLDLTGTGVTDAGVQELAGLEKLQLLDLTGTLATEAGTKELRKKFPPIQIRGARKETAARPGVLGKAPRPGALVQKFQSEGSVSRLAFAGDGKTLLSLGTDGSQLWEVATGKLLRTYKEFPPRIWGELPLIESFALSADGEMAALGPVLVEVATGKVRVLKSLEDSATGSGKTRPPEEIAAAPVAESTNAAVSFSPDGQLLAMGGASGKIRVWQTATLKQLHMLRWQDMENSALAFSPGGKLMAAGSRHGRIGLWEVATGKQLRTLGRAQPFETVTWLEFSGDGKVLASCTANTPYRFWDVATGKQRFELPNNEFGMVLSPDGRLVASWGGDNIIHIREVATRKERRLEGHSQEITCVAYSPDGKTLVSTGLDQTLRFWDVGTGLERFLHKQPGDGAITALAFAPDGKILASATGPGGKIQLWDPATAKEISK
jgi:WD40 repeat protein